MRRTAPPRVWLLLVVLSALFAAFPTAAYADQTPVDPTLPVPTIPAADPCGTAASPAWMGRIVPGKITLYIGIPRPRNSDEDFRGTVHVFDVDGTQSADGLAPEVDGPITLPVDVPLTPRSGHTYGWSAATQNGTSSSSSTATCYFAMDGDAPTAAVITNPDFPPVGSGGIPTKSEMQPTTFTFTSHEVLPEGCAEAGEPDCGVSGLDHFAYSVDNPVGIGSPQVPASASGTGSLTLSTLGWGTHTLYVEGVDAAQNSLMSAYSFSVPWQLPPPLPPGTGTYHPVTPTRLLDTRTSGPTVPASTTTKLLIAGNTAVPGLPAAGVTAVVLNVTATRTASAGVLTAWADGNPRPTTSNLNWTAKGQTVSNLATVPVGTDGAVDLVANSATAIIADIQGYYTHDTTGATYVALTPQRLVDTRNGTGLSSTSPISNFSSQVALAGQGGVPYGAAAVVVNLTATGTVGAGYLAATPDGSGAPGVSNLNWSGSGATVAGLAVLPVGPHGAIDVFVHGSSHVIIDVVGYFAADASGGRFSTVAPHRMLDTRAAIGVTTTAPLPSGGTLALPIAGRADVPVGAKAVVLNVTATGTTSAGVLTAWADGSPQPPTSNLNWTAKGQTVPNLVIIPVGPDGKVALHVNSTTHVIADVFGYYA